MAKATPVMTPSLSSFLKSIKSQHIEASIIRLISYEACMTSMDGKLISSSLLKRRQIRNSRPCAIATAHLMRKVVASSKVTDLGQLIARVHEVGQRLTAAQPREFAVGNIVRRVLGVIREEAEEDRDGETSSFSEANTDSRPHTPSDALSPRPSQSSPLRQSEYTIDLPDQDNFRRPPLLTSHTSYAASTATPMATSMFNLLSHPNSSTYSPSGTPGNQSPSVRSSTPALGTSGIRDLRAEIIEGIEEIIDELDQVDDQIAGYALEHIHSNEIILTYSSSATVQKFLLKAATKRKFTVIHAESFPNNHEATHATVMGRSESDGEDEMGAERFSKPLTAAGITVVLIPDAAVFALMSRVNKVILGTHVVLANGGLVAAAGAKAIAKAAQVHKTPVVVVTGVYKLSPIYPFDFDSLIEYGDAGKVFGYEEGDLVEKVDVENPLFDYVPAELVDLYITNL